MSIKHRSYGLPTLKRLYAPPKFNSSSNSSSMPNLLCPDDVTANGRYGWNENPFTVSKIKLIRLERAYYRTIYCLNTPRGTQVQETHTSSCLEACYPLTTLKVIDMNHPILCDTKFLFQCLLGQHIINSNNKMEAHLPTSG